MRRFAIATSLMAVLTAAPALAQQAPAPAQAPAPPAPFPQGAKVGIVNLQQIASLSADGKVATARVNALIQKKQVEGATKSKQLQENQTKLEQQGGALSAEARTALEKDIERQNVEGQRFQQDAQAEVQELQNELQQEFQKKLFPILQQMAKEKDLHLLLSAADAGVIWADTGIDLTAEAIRRLDAAAPAKPAASAPAAAAPRLPAAPAAAAPKPAAPAAPKKP
jgi:Skp family chaperone for outer membrane proteins